MRKSREKFSVQNLLTLATSSMESFNQMIASALQSADKIAVEVRGERARSQRYQALAQYLEFHVSRAAALQSFNFSSLLLHKILETGNAAEAACLAFAYEQALLKVTKEKSMDFSPLEMEAVTHLKKVFSAWPYANEKAEKARVKRETKRHVRVQQTLEQSFRKDLKTLL